MEAQKLKQLVNDLENAGMIFEKGLTERQFKEIESANDFQFPPDLKAFLHYGVPIRYVRRSVRPTDFPNWHEDPQAIMQRHQGNILRAFKFDVEHSNFWMEEWGNRPEKLDDAFQIVERALANVPQLIPLFAHRYLPSTPVKAGNPILSMWQANDTIYYGRHLEDYWRNEFQLSLQGDKPRPHFWESSKYRTIPFWSKIVMAGDSLI